MNSCTIDQSQLAAIGGGMHVASTGNNMLNKTQIFVTRFVIKTDHNLFRNIKRILGKETQTINSSY